jgi:hypothetical protein
VEALPRWTADPRVELINPWRYWMFNKGEDPATAKKIVSYNGPVEGPAGRRVLSVVGKFGWNTMLKHTFFNKGKLDPGRYRFTCQVRGSAGMRVQFEAGYGWGDKAAEPATITLSPQWRTHAVDFEIKGALKDYAALRFRLPRDSGGEFHLTDTHLRRTD